jgi:hypothetical protein
MITPDILIDLFPANRENKIADIDKAILLMLDLTFESLDGKTVVKRKGQLLSHPVTFSPLSVKEVITNEFQSRKWTTAIQRNEGLTTFSAFQKKWQEDNLGVPVISPKFQNDLESHIKTVANFDYYS